MFGIRPWEMTDLTSNEVESLERYLRELRKAS